VRSRRWVPAGSTEPVKLRKTALLRRPYHRSLRAQMPKIRHLPNDRHVAVELGAVDPRCYDLVQILLPSVRLDR
jgi:hypothetical protein